MIEAINWLQITLSDKVDEWLGLEKVAVGIYIKTAQIIVNCAVQPALI